MRPVNPDHLRLYVSRLLEALRRPLLGAGIERWKDSEMQHYEPVLRQIAKEFPQEPSA